VCWRDTASPNPPSSSLSLSFPLSLPAGGGHLNHSIFWQNLAPPSEGGGVLPEHSPEGQALLAAITAQWGSLEAFQATFSAQTVAVQG
jgi:superoxide dismutase, Fe-Mn family